MLLMAVDIGNTNVVIGFIDDGRIAGTYRITTKANHTSDEYGLMITQFLALSGYKPADVDDVIISSVVPKVMHSFRASIVKFLDIDPMIVGPGIKTGLNIRMDNPQNMGADCIADCAGAYYEYGGPILVADFGTATTMSAVTAHGEFLGGCILPGVRVAVDALTERAAKLPKIDLELPKSVIGRNTVSCMQAGLLYGYVGQLEYLVSAFKQEMNAPQARVVATGGMSGVIAGMTKCINITDRLLTLEGLRILYKLNAG